MPSRAQSPVKTNALRRLGYQVHNFNEALLTPVALHGQGGETEGELKSSTTRKSQSYTHTFNNVGGSSLLGSTGGSLGSPKQLAAMRTTRALVALGRAAIFSPSPYISSALLALLNGSVPPPASPSGHTRAKALRRARRHFSQAAKFRPEVPFEDALRVCEVIRAGGEDRTAVPALLQTYLFDPTLLPVAKLERYIDLLSRQPPLLQLQAAALLLQRGFYLTAIKIVYGDFEMLHATLEEMRLAVEQGRHELNEDVLASSWIWKSFDRDLFLHQFQKLKIVEEYVEFKRKQTESPSEDKKQDMIATSRAERDMLVNLALDFSSQIDQNEAAKKMREDAERMRLRVEEERGRLREEARAAKGRRAEERRAAMASAEEATRLQKLREEKVAEGRQESYDEVKRRAAKTAAKEANNGTKPPPSPSPTPPRTRPLAPSPPPPSSPPRAQAAVKNQSTTPKVSKPAPVSKKTPMEKEPMAPPQASLIPLVPPPVEMPIVKKESGINAKEAALAEAAEALVKAAADHEKALMREAEEADQPLDPLPSLDPPEHPLKTVVREAEEADRSSSDHDSTIESAAQVAQVAAQEAAQVASREVSRDQINEAELEKEGTPRDSLKPEEVTVAPEAQKEEEEEYEEEYEEEEEATVISQAAVQKEVEEEEYEDKYDKEEEEEEEVTVTHQASPRALEVKLEVSRPDRSSLSSAAAMKRAAEAVAEAAASIVQDVDNTSPSNEAANDPKTELASERASSLIATALAVAANDADASDLSSALSASVAAAALSLRVPPSPSSKDRPSGASSHRPSFSSKDRPSASEGMLGSNPSPSNDRPSALNSKDRPSAPNSKDRPSAASSKETPPAASTPETSPFSMDVPHLPSSRPPLPPGAPTAALSPRAPIGPSRLSSTTNSQRLPTPDQELGMLDDFMKKSEVTAGPALSLVGLGAVDPLEGEFEGGSLGGLSKADLMGLASLPGTRPGTATGIDRAEVEKGIAAMRDQMAESREAKVMGDGTSSSREASRGGGGEGREIVVPIELRTVADAEAAADAATALLDRHRASIEERIQSKIDAVQVLQIERESLKSAQSQRHQSREQQRSDGGLLSSPEADRAAEIVEEQRLKEVALRLAAEAEAAGVLREQKEVIEVERRQMEAARSQLRTANASDEEVAREMAAFQVQLVQTVKLAAMLQSSRMEGGSLVPLDPLSDDVTTPAASLLNLNPRIDDPPSQDEVEDYASYLGIEDPDLVYIAEWALTAPVPESWTVHLDKEGNEFFYEMATGRSIYEHPLDSHYRALYEEKKKEKEAMGKSGE